jgi:ribokinase
MVISGLDAARPRRSSVPTLYSFCFLYPTAPARDDGRLGVSRVDAPCGERGGLPRLDPGLAAPEVPLEAREAILKLGTRHGFFRVASFTAGELSRESTRSLAGYADLLALNRDEAAAFGGAPSAAASPTAAIEAAVRLAVGRHPTLMLTITAGAAGSWLWDGSDLDHLPALPVAVANTAGAGDAHVSGIIAGLAAGLDPAAAHQVAVLTAACSVTSPHTISPGLDRPALWALARSAGMTLSPEVRQLLEDDR